MTCLIATEHAQSHAYDYGLWPCVPTQLLWNTLNRTYDVAALFGAQAVRIGGFVRAGEGLVVVCFYGFLVLRFGVQNIDHI